jgi:hypothetical protein
MTIVYVAKVVVKPNGENEPYFNTYHGLRQEDPPSEALLFDLAKDILIFMIGRAVVGLPISRLISSSCCRKWSINIATCK